MYRAYAVNCVNGAASLTSMIILYWFLHSALQIHEFHMFIISILTRVAVKLIWRIKAMLNAITFHGHTNTLASIFTQHFRAATVWCSVLAINLIREVTAIITTIARPPHTRAVSIVASKLIWSARLVSFWQKRWETKPGITKFYAFA